MTPEMEQGHGALGSPSATPKKRGECSECTLYRELVIDTPKGRACQECGDNMTWIPLNKPFVWP